jgi:hypothetical protein
MVKGVNRQVLEIIEPQCDYFEKALFFVKPEYSNESDMKLRNQALRSIQNSSVPKTRKQKIKSKAFLVVELLSSALVGSIITALIIK